MGETLSNGSLIAERYLVLNEKRGGMGRVFFCNDIVNDRKEIVVLKTLLDEFLCDANSRKRFEKEASVWLSLGDISDNYVLGLLEIVLHDGLPFLKMKYCSNGSLTDLLLKGPISYPSFIQYSTQLLIGMELIDCSFNLVHRDLKPENILFDEDNNLKITDLGIVKTLQDTSYSDKKNFQNSRLTQFKGFIGTIPYAAPEQILDSSGIDQRADIWAFGIILYEMLTRRNPFYASSINSFVRNIFEFKPPHIKSIYNLPNKMLGNIIMKCFEKNPEDRYSNFSDIIIDWDKIIKVKNSREHRSLIRKDKRILVDIPFVNFMWDNYFPERYGGYQVTFNIAAARGLKDAENYRKIGNYKASLESYDKVLGTKTNNECYLHDFLENYHIKYAENAKALGSMGSVYDRKKMKLTIIPPPFCVQEALLGKLISLVDLIEEGKDPAIKN